VNRNVSLARVESDFQAEDVAREVAENAADAIFMMDMSGRITFVNPAAARLFGWSQDELLGQVLHDVLHHHRPDGSAYPRSECPLAQAYRSGLTLAGQEDVFFHKDGSPVPVSCSNAPIRRGDTVVGSVLTVQDVTERKRSDAALRESEAFVRSVLESSPDCLKVVDLEGRLVYMNSNGLCIMEIDDFSCLRGQAWADLWPAEAEGQITAAVAEARQGRTARFSAFCPTAKGTPKWWDVTVSPVFDDQGRVKSLLSNSRDITERQQHEEALRAALERNTNILESINDYYYALDAEWRFTAVNGKVAERSGRPREEIIGRRLWDLFPQAAGPEAYGEAPGAPGERRVLNAEIFSRELGIWVEATVYRDQTGTEAYFRDITARKEAEIALSDSEARFRTLAEAIPQLVWSARPDGFCDYLNGQWIEYTGVAAERHHGLNWLDVVHPEDRQRTAAAWQAFIAGAEPYDVEYRLKASDGSYRWFQARASVQRNGAGEPVRVFGTSTDISDRKEAEERQHLMTRELHHRVKNTLATVQAVISSTARRAKTITEFYDAVSSRIISLAKTHTLLVNNTWGGATVEDLFRAELEAYDDSRNSRITLEGPTVQLPSEVALALGMAAHELTTNAAKYGALSLPDGKVAVRWSVKEADSRYLVLDWIERNGPSVQTPERKGFGSMLLERVLGRQLKGEVSIDYAQEGLRLHLQAPLIDAHREPSA
jgi:PAS domain S-box-containing protein